MPDHGPVTEPDTEQPEQRRCRRGAGCGLRERDAAGLPVGAALELPGLCPRDEHLLRQALHELPELWTALRALIAPSGAAAPTDTAADGPARSALPLRPAPLVLADQIRSELTGWETLVRSNMAMSRPVITVPGDVADEDRADYIGGWAVGRAARVLRDATPTLLALASRPLLRWDLAGEHRGVVHLDGIDGACLLIDLHRRAVSTAGRARLIHHLPMPCPRCEHWTLQRDNGDDHAHCTTCGGQWDEQRYGFLGRLLLADLDTAARCPDCDERGVLPDDTLCPHPALLTDVPG